MSATTPLPPGQVPRGDFPRFGITKFAHRFPAEPVLRRLVVDGEVQQTTDLRAEDLHALPRVEIVADFHCVTTWSHRGLHWQGWRFADVFKHGIAPKPQAQWVVLHGQDGGRACMQLDDLLAGDVLIADTLNGAPLSVEHGAPWRLVAPAHYGYKSVKHLRRLQFVNEWAAHRASGWRFMEHPRARVALEERGQGAPGWLLRHLYRPLVMPTVAYFKRATEKRR
jgi:DMSO/TMAO reductase YedYZ molybdopterin-dependent catalytic subunit